MVAGERGRLGELIREARRRVGLTQQEAANLAGLSVAGLRDVEQGRVTRPRLSTLRRLGEVLGWSSDELNEMLRSVGGGQGTGLRIEVLGPLRVLVDGAVVDPGSESQRVLTALLALSPNAPVARDTLVEAIWGDRSGDGAVDSLQSRMSRLRRRLRPGAPDSDSVLTAVRGGYQLSVTEDQHDLLVFRGLIDRARRLRDAGETEEACSVYADAVGLWRGVPLEGMGALQSHPVVAGFVREYPAVAVEYAAVASRIGRYQQLLPLLQRIAETEPLHEAVHAALMIAMAGSGQQAAALHVFDTLRRRLASELGADPGQELTAAYQRVLRQEVARPDFTPVSAHAQLPPDIADFSGREAELRQLRESLPVAGNAAVTVRSIEGMGGVGKTRLAVRLANQLLAEGRYAEHQLYVDLRGHAEQPPADPSAVLASFLRLLDVPSDQIPPSLEERSTLYRTCLRDKEALVLLDNAAGEDQVLPLLPASPTNVVLITSRRALALDSSRSLPLSVFTAEESRQLLARSVEQARVSADSAAVDRVVELCGGLPLAVALAGRRLQSRPAWGFADLARRLEETADRIGEFAVGNRQLQAVFDLSYDALDGPHRRVFRLLGLHPGDVLSGEAAAALAGLAPLRARRLLDRLADEHLVGMVSGDRYRLHDLLYVYAGNMTDREESEQARRDAIGRLLDFYLHTAVKAGQQLQPSRRSMELVGNPPAHGPALANWDEAKQWLDTERPNLIAAVALAAENGWPAHAWQLTRSLREYLHLFGYSHDQDWVRTHEAALAAAVVAKDAVGEALTRTDLAVAYMYHGRGEDARKHLYRALEYHRRASDWELEVNTLGLLGRLCYRLGDFAEALGHLRRAASLAVGRNTHAESMICLHIGMILVATGDVDDALAHYERALTLCRHVGNADGEIAVLADIGDVYRQKGRHTEAVEHLKRALTLAVENGMSPREAYVRHRLGNVYRDQGRFDQAVRNLSEALRIVRAVGGAATESAVIIDLGATNRSIGDLATAYNLLDQGLRLAIKQGERYQEARGLYELAELHRTASRPELARDHWRRAHNLFAELGTPEARKLRLLLGPVRGLRGVDSVA